MPHDFPGTHHHQVTVRRRHQHFPPLWRPTGIGALQAAPTSPEGHKAILRHRRDHHLCGMASHGWSKLRVFWWRVPNVSDICGIWMNLVCFLVAGFCCRCFCIGCQENVSPRAGPTYVCGLRFVAARMTGSFSAPSCSSIELAAGWRCGVLSWGLHLLTQAAYEQPFWRWNLGQMSWRKTRWLVAPSYLKSLRIVFRKLAWNNSLASPVCPIHYLTEIMPRRELRSRCSCLALQGSKVKCRSRATHECLVYARLRCFW